MFKTYFAAVAALGIVFFLTMLSPFAHEEKSSQNVLKVGLESGYPPFEYVDSHGSIIGFDVDVAQLIAEKLGKTLVVTDMEFEGEILSLKQGKIDLIISGMNITPDRLKEIDMIPYHGDASTNLALLFWNDIPQGIATLQDITKLPHAFVSVETGSIPEIFLSNYPDIQKKSFQGAVAPLMDVKFGKSIANLVQPEVAEYFQKQHPEIKSVSVPLKEGEEIMGFGIGIKKGNHALSEQVQRAISELKASGKIQQLEEKWFKGGI